MKVATLLLLASWVVFFSDCRPYSSALEAKRSWKRWVKPGLGKAHGPGFGRALKSGSETEPKPGFQRIETPSSKHARQNVFKRFINQELLSNLVKKKNEIFIKKKSRLEKKNKDKAKDELDSASHDLDIDDLLGLNRGPNVTGNASSCKAEEFSCRDTGRCIPSQWRCDTEEDCPDGSDESDCRIDNLACRADQFPCGTDPPTCIPGSWRCDHHEDCPNDMDERNCTTKTCRPGTFLCNDTSNCILEQWRCDEDIDCRDGSDEWNCIAAGEEPRLLYANRQEIREVRLHSFIHRPIVEGLYSAVALDYDYREQFIYWSDIDSGIIARKKLSDENRTDTDEDMTRVLVEDIDQPIGIAFDWVHKNLYWINLSWKEKGNNSIEVMSVSDPTKPYRAVLFNSDLAEPRAIVVDPRESERRMYWTDWGDTPKIERANLDGTDRTKILGGGSNLSPALVWPNGLAIDYETNRLFWVDAKLHHICTSDLEGGQARVVFSSTTYLQHPFSIDVFQNTAYWSDWEASSVLMVGLERNLSRAVVPIAQDLWMPMDVRVYHEQKQPLAPNACEASGCDHLCLPSRGGHFVCTCSEYGGSYQLQDDGKTCANVSSSPTAPPTSAASKPTPGPADSSSPAGTQTDVNITVEIPEGLAGYDLVYVKETQKEFIFLKHSDNKNNTFH